MACPHLSQFETATPWWRREMDVDVYCRSTSIVSALRNRLVLTVNDSVNVSRDKPYVLEPNTAGYVGLAVTVVFPSFLCKKPSKLSNEELTDEVSLNKETEEAWEARLWSKKVEKREGYETTEYFVCLIFILFGDSEKVLIVKISQIILCRSDHSKYAEIRKFSLLKTFVVA